MAGAWSLDPVQRDEPHRVDTSQSPEPPTRRYQTSPLDERGGHTSIHTGVAAKPHLSGHGRLAGPERRAQSRAARLAIGTCTSRPDHSYPAKLSTSPSHHVNWPEVTRAYDIHAQKQSPASDFTRFSSHIRIDPRSQIRSQSGPWPSEGLPTSPGIRAVQKPWCDHRWQDRSMLRQVCKVRKWRRYARADELQVSNHGSLEQHRAQQRLDPRYLRR